MRHSFIYRLASGVGVILTFLFFQFAPLQAEAQAQSVPCQTSTPASGAYTATVCITAPANNGTLSGEVTVNASVSVSNAKIGVQRMVFYLNGAYLLTDYQAPYTFTLPTAQWVDGDYTLAVEALLRDSYTTQRATATVHFKNSVKVGPGNHNLFEPSKGSAPTNGAAFVVAASGDGASGEGNAEKVTRLISSLNPNLFLYLGDVYEKGSPTEFYNWYGPEGSLFGQFRSITNPTIGNHEYTTGTAQGYFTYWDNIPNYYSFDAGGWHFVSLNSNFNFAGVDGKSSQYQWLAGDLSAHENACTIVYYHHPLFNIGPEGPTQNLTEIWTLMAQHKVSIVLNGHDHDYQRWVPLDGSGQPAKGGVTEFVAGGGGHGLQTFKKTDSRVAFSSDANPDAFGALKLTLHPGGADFNYVSITNGTIDSGTIPCEKSGQSIATQGASSTAPIPVSGSTPAATVEPVVGTPVMAATTEPSVATPVPAATAAQPVSPVQTTRPTQAAAVSSNPAAISGVAPTTAPFELPIKFSPSQAVALGGLAAVVLIGLVVIARRHS